MEQIYAVFNTTGTPIGFYNKELHGDTIPIDAIAISTADYEAYISNQGAWVRDPVTGNRIATQPNLGAMVARNIDQLWNAANDYNYSRISGPAIGLLALGVLQSKPKSLAIQAWVKSIWTLYYTRKAQVTGTAPIGAAALDFSSCGEMPYTVQDLMAEVG